MSNQYDIVPVILNKYDLKCIQMALTTWIQGYYKPGTSAYNEKMELLNQINEYLISPK